MVFRPDINVKYIVSSRFQQFYPAKYPVVFPPFRTPAADVPYLFNQPNLIKKYIYLFTMNELCTVCTFVGVQKCNRNREWICLRHKTLPSQNISNVAQKHPHAGWIEINSETIIYSIILWNIPCDIVCELVLHVTIPFSSPPFVVRLPFHFSSTTPIEYIFSQIF